VYQGRRASRLPLAFIFRALGATAYSAPLALRRRGFLSQLNDELFDLVRVARIGFVLQE
jgi:hypothetical protein